MKEFNPKIKIIGVEPKGADGMNQSLKKGNVYVEQFKLIQLYGH